MVPDCLSAKEILAVTRASHKEIIATRAAGKMFKSALMMLSVATLCLCSENTWHRNTPRPRHRRGIPWYLDPEDPQKPKEPYRVLRCYLQLDKGRCRDTELLMSVRWYFDWKKNDCFMFLWEGCTGFRTIQLEDFDRNRFDTWEECRRACWRWPVPQPKPRRVFSARVPLVKSVDQTDIKQIFIKLNISTSFSKLLTPLESVFWWNRKKSVDLTEMIPLYNEMVFSSIVVAPWR